MDYERAILINFATQNRQAQQYAKTDSRTEIAEPHTQTVQPCNKGLFDVAGRRQDSCRPIRRQGFADAVTAHG